jgi:methylenetetrahydrofolate reductase (NADPH)
MTGLDVLLRSPRYEVLPTKGAEQAVQEWVPAGMTVTVTASPVKGLEPTIELTERLAAGGYRVIPHLAARSVADDAHLERIIARLKAAGVDDVFVPGGDAPHPAGPFDSALPLLERLAEMGGPFSRIGITGYPESHPKISDDITIQAMWDKRRYASYIVSNVCFDAAQLGRWIQRIRPSGPACCGWPRWPARPSRPASSPGTRAGCCGSGCPADTARTGCSTARPAC